MDSSRQSKLRHKLSGQFLSFTSGFRRKQDSNTLATNTNTPPIVVMNESDSVKVEDVSTPDTTAQNMSTPHSRPTTATIHEGFTFSLSDDQSCVHSLGSPAVTLPYSEDTSRPMSVQQDVNPSFHFEDNLWPQKPFDQYMFHGLSNETQIGQALTTDDAIPIIDLDNQEGAQGACSPNLDATSVSNRMSGSSFTMSTPGAMSDVPAYEDFSTAFSDVHSFCSDYPPPSNRTSWMSSTHLSPVASPRIAPQSRPELVRTQSRGRASPSPRPGMRSAPYSIDGSRSKRWSTGSYAPGRRASPYVSSMGPENFMPQQPTSQPPFFMACPPPHMQRNSMLLPTQLPSQLPSQPIPTDARALDGHPPLLSQGLFKLLSNVDTSSNLHRRYAELSDPPDLFGSLSEEQIPPPPEDMNPEDPEMTPREQDLRFEGDLYTPRWVRGHGNKREGWCGICKPGRWLVLKNSAFWYDKSFSHGISAATGAPFQEPLETRRMDGNPDVWEGLCAGCNDWIALVSSKKKGTTWFRHAYKCHAHPKAKDSAKRRRENSFGRGNAGGGNPTPTKVGRMDNLGHRPTTPHSMTPMSAINTPPPSEHHHHAHCHPHGHPHQHHPMMPANMGYQPMPHDFSQMSMSQAPPNFTLMSMGQPFPNMI